MIGYIIAAVGLAAVCWLGNGIRRIGAVSRGPQIGSRSGSALLLIDLQTVFWDHGPYADTAKAAAQAAILAEVAAAKASNTPVIALRQEWSLPATRIIARLAMKGQAVAGSPGTEIAAPFAGLADEVLVKRVQDSFETGALDPLLARLNVGKLRIVGLDMAYCVAKTALAARQRGYAVEIATKATLSGNPAAAEKARVELLGQGAVLS